MPAGLARFDEPTEGAYSIGMPRGWRATGGVLRSSSTTSGQPWLRAQSPDGRTVIHSGRRAGTMSYIQSDMPVSLSGVERRAVVPAERLAEEAAQQAAREAGCTAGIEVRERLGPEQVLAGMAEAPRARWKQNAQQARQSGAQATIAGVVYRCGPWTGYADVTRFVQPAAGMVSWTAFPGGVLTQGDLREARQLLARMAASFQTNPSWAANQQRAAAEWQRNWDAGHPGRMAAIRASGDRSRAMYEDSQRRADANQADWNRRQGERDEMHRRTSNAILGTVDVYDPATGTVHSGVDNSADYYWTDDDQNVYGTSGAGAYENPDTDVFNPTINMDDAYDAGYRPDGD